MNNLKKIIILTLLGITTTFPSYAQEIRTTHLQLGNSKNIYQNPIEKFESSYTQAIQKEMNDENIIYNPEEELWNKNFRSEDYIDQKIKQKILIRSIGPALEDAIKGMPIEIYVKKLKRFLPGIQYVESNEGKRKFNLLKKDKRNEEELKFSSSLSLSLLEHKYSSENIFLKFELKNPFLDFNLKYHPKELRAETEIKNGTICFGIYRTNEKIGFDSSYKF